MRAILTIAATSAVLTVCVTVPPFQAAAHTAASGWQYDTVCCSGMDCHEIPDSAVSATSDGYQVTIQPGQHPFITDKTGPRTYVVPYSKARQSKDEHFHLCIRPSDQNFLCLYAPPQGA